MTTTTNLYIDSIYVKEKTGSFTNILNGVSDLASGILTTSGYEWIVQIVNPTGSTITNNIGLDINTAYIDGSGNYVNGDTRITISADISAGASYYVGNASVSGITLDQNPGGNTYYLADQERDRSGTDRILVGTKFKLFMISAGGEVDNVGINTKDATNPWLTNSLINIINTSPGTLRRKATGGEDAPSTTFTASDWVTASSGHVSYLQGSIAGDPHIKTLTNECYMFDYLGAFRLFEFENNDNTIIINGLSEEGPNRWVSKQYIRKLYIKHNEKNIVLDMGFRGEQVKVLKNNGIEYDEKQLSFDTSARRHSISSKYSTTDINKEVTEDLPGLIRNEIKIFLNSDKTNKNLVNITLQNVNRYNLQPCRVNINTNINIKYIKGCVAHRKYAPVSKLNDIENDKKIKEPTGEELKQIPNIEIEPIKRDHRYE